MAQVNDSRKRLGQAHDDDKRYAVGSIKKYLPGKLLFEKTLENVLKKHTDFLQFTVIKLTNYEIIGHTRLHCFYRLFYFSIGLWPVGV